MADFAAVLRKTVGGLKENTPETRAKIYEKARATVEAKLATASAPPQLVERQKGLLEEAIRTVEAEYTEPPAFEAELEEVFADLGAPAPEAEAADSDAAAQEAIPAAAVEAADAPRDQAPATPAVAGGFTAFSADGPAHPPPPLAAASAPQPANGPVEGPEAVLDAGPPPVRRRRAGGALLFLLLLVLVLGAAAVGGWLYRDDVARLAGFESFDRMVAGDAAPTETPPAEDVAETEVEPEAVAAEGGTQKFTQRLLPDGREVDEGPAATPPTLGEGTSVAEATAAGVAGEAEPEASGSMPVGQRAIFYEERAGDAEGSAEGGRVVWSVVQESPGGNQPPEPAVHADLTIPERDLQLKMTIRRNADRSLPASHILELIFLTPDDFPGGGIGNVLRVAMKSSEQDTGSPLLGIPTEIADGFFLVALSDSRADVETNTLLMRRQSWIDIPIVYSSGRRALITMEKGVPGERVFNEVLEAWERASNG